jgi:betaine-aldehyde dehydrogenase
MTWYPGMTSTDRTFDWRLASPKDRARRVGTLRHLIAVRQDAIAAAIVADTGKPVTEAMAQEVTAALGFIDDAVRRYPGYLRSRRYRYLIPGFMGKTHRIEREPVGTVAVIGPGNFPFSIPVMQAVSALLCGNSIFLKPSERAPRTNQELSGLFAKWDAGVGLVRIVSGGPDAAMALVNDPSVRLVLYTGGNEGGAAIATACGRLMKRCVLELGGDAAAIVCEDADVDLAARGIAWSAFSSSGNSCIGTRRVYVHQRVAGEFREALERTIGGLTAGDPADPSTDLRPDMKEAAREWLSNVVVVESDEEAVRRANESAYGLSASVWTSSRRRASRASQALEVGMVWINDASAGEPRFPWGGRKGSGIGRLYSEEGVYELTHTKITSGEYPFFSAGKTWWYPYGRTKLRLLRIVNRWLGSRFR